MMFLEKLRTILGKILRRLPAHTRDIQSETAKDQVFKPLPPLPAEDQQVSTHVGSQAPESNTRRSRDASQRAGSPAQTINGVLTGSETQPVASIADPQPGITQVHVRFIAAKDGLFILTPGFSASIKAALQAERDLCESKHRYHAEWRAALAFQSRVKARIAKIERRQQKLPVQAQDTAGSEEGNCSASQKVASELEELRMLLADAVEEQNRLRQTLFDEVEAFIDVQQRANSYLQDAFTEAGLLPPWSDNPSAQIATRDVDGELQDVRNTNSGHLCEANGGDAPFDHHHSPQIAEADDSLSELGKLQQVYEQARVKLVAAQADFNDRVNMRDRMKSADQAGLSSSAFDVAWVKENSRLTRELIEAEDAFRKTKDAMLEAGYDSEAGRLSGVGGSGWTQAYALDECDNLIDTAPRDQIYRWRRPPSYMLEVPSSGPVSEPELDSWDGSEIACGLECLDVVRSRTRVWIREQQRKCGLPVGG